MPAGLGLGTLNTNDERNFRAWGFPAHEIFADAERVLPGWTFRPAVGTLPAVGADRTLWSDENDVLVVSLADSRFLLSFTGFATFEIDPSQKASRIWLDAQATPDTLRHLIFDQVLPRLIAHQGRLVLHAAALRGPMGAILFVGPSGRGKSTLVASFQDRSTKMLGDDAIVLSGSNGSIVCEATYPSLRLYPDSLAALFGAPPVTESVAQYTTKRSIQGLIRAESSPVAAIFVLDEPEADQISIRPMRISDACMTLVEQSFSLNPTDTRCAQQRLQRASEAASAIPSFTLSYPRDFSRLPEVRERIMEAVHGLGGVTASR